MKIIHTSDWHLGQNFYKYDRDDEHRHFFSQLAALLDRERPDALLVSGDIFHNSAPPITAKRLFVEGVILLHDASPETIIVITAGNHDSGTRLEAERELWQRLGIHVVGSCARHDDGTFDPNQFVVEISGKGHVLAIPYFHPSNYPLASVDTLREDRQLQFFESVLRQASDSNLPIVMMAHLAIEGCSTKGHEDQPIGGMYMEQIKVLGDGYDYIALGHIHMPQQIGDRAYYSGSPIPLSFSEDYDHYVNIVEIASKGALPKISQIVMEPIKRVTTIPPEGAPLDLALKAFADLDPQDNSYVRILVDQDEILAADAEDRARKIAEGKACRFCEIRRKPRDKQPKNDRGSQIEEIDDFKRFSPMDIALMSYERNNQSSMPDFLKDMMQQAINLATNQNQ